jgi:N-acyl-D-amino-acid deacylase
MLRRILASLAGAALLMSAFPASAQEQAAYDIVIRNGRVIDGAGNPWVLADVAIDEGRIAAIGRVTGRGAREIDATGRYVSPGFIDMQDQSGEVLLRDGSAENKLRMGVTTLIAGEAGTPVEATELAGYFDRLQSQGIAVNFGTYYAAAQARVRVMGDRAGRPSRRQMEAMRNEVRAAMQAGAFGISTALIYPPQSFQSTEDLIELARVVGQCDGMYATHMRDESEALLDGIAEAVRIGEEAGVRVEIYHLKAAYAPRFGELMPAAVAAINAARARGVDVAANMYPYTAGGTGLAITVPNWVFADGEERGYQRLRDPRVRERLRREVEAGSQPGWSNLVHAAGGWDRVVLANAHSARFSPYEGQSIAAIAQQIGGNPADVAWDITLEGLPNRVTALFFLMDERDVEYGLRQPWVSIGTDADASERNDPNAMLMTHPRAYGTFPRVIAEYGRRRGVLTLEDAVRKMTSWPATRMGLSDRGVLREGLRADVTIFDYDNLDDVANYQNSRAAPVGIGTVIVNGQVALDENGPTNARAGHVLRHRCN